MSKEIYVNSYTRADGTEVSGYYRTVPDGDNGNFENPDLLQGGISIDEYNLFDTNGNSENLDTIIETLEQKNQNAQNEENNILNQMVNTKDKNVYKDLYNSYQEIRNINIKNQDFLNRLKYAKSNNDYETIFNELQKYNSNFNKIVNNNRKTNPLPHPESEIPNLLLSFSSIPIPKAIIDMGMYGYNKIYNVPDAKEMWKAASHDFRQSHEYISRNGALVGSISDLPPNQDFQKIVQAKVYQQLGLKDSMGVIFKSDSDISREVAISPEIKQHFLENKDILLNKKVVKNKSTYFKSSKNLSLSIGHGDIVYSYLDNNGNLISLLLDTYDMNKNDTDWKVQLAHQVQEKGEFRTYYSIFITKTNHRILQKWLKN